MSDHTNIALKTADELTAHIKLTEERHRTLMTSLRALQRSRAAEEAMQVKEADA